jgi:hypothetical protein
MEGAPRRKPGALLCKQKENDMEAKTIRIIDGHYNLQFTVEDGGWITVDGKPHQVHYLDETHFAIGRYRECFHICQFGELSIDRGRIVAKMDKEA